jgi:hypothetical protein
LADALSDAINGLGKAPLKVFDTRSVGAALQHHVKDRPIAMGGEVWKLTAAPRTSGKDKVKWKLERIGSSTRDDDLSDLL